MSGKKKADQVTPMVCQKNDILTLEIVDMGTEGEGIGKKDGYTLFVKDALIGDVVRVCVMKTKKHFGYARLLEIVTPSPYRREPVCPVARQCGGCQLQHCTYEKQLIWKEEKVQSCLNRIGGFSVCLDRDMTKEEHRRYEQGNPKSIVMEPILGMDTPYHYRNKAQFPVGLDKEGRLVAGFYAGRTHSIIENTDCAIQHPCNHAIVETVLQYMRDYQIAPRLFRLIQHLFGHIDGQQRLMHFVLGPSHDETGIVIRLLQTERSISFDHFGNILDFHDPTTLFEKAIIFSTYHIRRSLVRGLRSRS